MRPRHGRRRSIADDDQIHAGLNSMWRNAAPIRHFDVVDDWLRSRGIMLDAFPANLRTATRSCATTTDRGCSYAPGDARQGDVGGRQTGDHPPDLSGLGGGKAAVDSPRKMYSAMPQGSAVRLAAAARRSASPKASRRRSPPDPFERAAVGRDLRQRTRQASSRPTRPTSADLRRQ